MALPKAFVGTLNQNAVLSALFNMIIGQEVFSKNINMKGTLVEKFRVDGTLYGDTKLFISTDVGTIYEFGDPASGNLLTKKNPLDPEVQAVSVDTFKQTGITIDGVKLKQAFLSADIYGAFVAVVVQWLRDAEKVLNITLINTFVGTTQSEADKGEVSVEIPQPLPDEPVYGVVEMQAWNTLVGELIGEEIANITVDLQDALRDYNEYGYLRAYDPADFMVVWNKKWSNKIKHVSLPMVFHKGDVIPTAMESIILNDRYFGTLLDEAGTADGTSVRTTVDKAIKVNGVLKQFFPGDILPEDTPYAAYEAYTKDDEIICKIIHKRSIPFMSALMVQTEFYNAKDLDRNHYLTWGYSAPTYLKEYPFITVRVA